MSKIKIALSRIRRDLKEINNTPLPGIGICMYENDPTKFIVNLKIMSGIYENYCLQLLLTFPETYPTNPPKILIFPEQGFNTHYHHHVFPEKNGFYKFCFDILDNDFMKTNEEKTGWNPSYSISTLLIQVQNFLSDPDFPFKLDKRKINLLMDSMKRYSRSFRNENNETVIHTWDNPYPEMCKESNEKKENKLDEEMNCIKENLVCFLLKVDYIEDPKIILGYPIIQSFDFKENMELFPIPEMLTYEGFVNQIQANEEKLDFYFDVKFKSANNMFYNYWIPIYIDKSHYEKNKTTILNAFAVIKFGPSGKKKHDFKPQYIFDVIPVLLCKMIIGIYRKKSTLSEAFIRCYFHYIFLFIKLIDLFRDDFNEYLMAKLNQIKNRNYDIDKKMIPDMGSFIMLLFFSKFEISRKMWYTLIEELFIRQIYWIFQSPENKEKIENIILKGVFAKNIEGLFNSFRNNPKKKLPSYFIEDVEKCGLMELFVDILAKDKNVYDYYKFNSFDYDSDQTGEAGEDNDTFEEKNFYVYSFKKENPFRNFIRKDFKANHKYLYNISKDETKEKFEELMVTRMDINKYYKVKKENGLSLSLEDVKKRYFTSKYNFLKTISPDIQKKILSFGYKSQIGNNLILITFIASNKIKEPNFIKNLEKHRGVLMNDEVREILNEIKNKTKSIKNWFELYEYIGYKEIYQGKTEFEFLLEGIKKSAEKKYSHI